MGLFIRDDDYDESLRMTGFNRYKQLLSFFAGHWVKLNLITTLGAIPLFFAVSFSILNSSILLLLPLSFLGGMVFGPFISGLIDSFQRALREDTNNRWDNYRKGFRQNIKCSLIPGGILGLTIGVYSFYFYMMYLSTVKASPATIAIVLFSMCILIIVFTLYWPQLVLFQQPFLTRIRNIILFSSKYLWTMLLCAVICILFYGFLFLFAPITLLVVPFIGFWYPLFVCQFFIYDKLNEELHIEELFSKETDHS